MISGHVLFGPRVSGHQMNSLPSNFYRTQSPKIIDVSTTPESPISPFGRIIGGQVTLQCPFVSIPDPRHRPAQGDRLYHLQDYISTFINENYKSSSKSYEFDIKHQSHNRQEFRLLRLGVYREFRSSYQFWEQVSNERFIVEVMLVETCEMDPGMPPPLVTDDTRSNSTKWRRLTLFEFYFNDARRYALPWATEELKADLRGPEWQPATLCLV